MAGNPSATNKESGQRRSPWLVTCIQCGLPIHRSTRMARQYCSDECAKERKRLIRAGRIARLCQLCGMNIGALPSRAKFCASCKPLARQKYTRDYNAANLEDVRDERRRYMADLARANPEGKRQAQRAWRIKHREKLNAQKRTPEYRIKAAARFRELNKLPKYNLHNRMASAIYQAIRKNKAGRKWEMLVGYTLEDLMRHIERQFTKGMSWQNIGKWHIDHVRPRAMFNYETAEDEGFKECWALWNLRPLWAKDNQKKHASRSFLV